MQGIVVLGSAHAIQKLIATKSSSYQLIMNRIEDSSSDVHVVIVR